MGRAIVLVCLPWVGLLMAGVAAAALLIWLSGARWQVARVWLLHRDQSGAVQSLSFVLTLPLFILVLLFIIQVSQLMIAAAVVQYAAFAAARAAIVWIPANLGSEEANCFATLCRIDRSAPGTVEPVWDLESPAFGPRSGGLTYVVEPGSPKYQKIWAAAVLACMAISPSSPNLVSVGGASGNAAPLPGNSTAVASVLERAYRAMVPRSQSDVSTRIRNKLAYAMENTQIEVRFYHPNSEVPLQDYSVYARPRQNPNQPVKPREVLDDRFQPLGFKAPSDPTVGTMELGWRDPITVTVYHQFALLPGPGRFLSRPNPKVPSDTVHQRISLQGGVYKYPLWASATLGNEGEKSVIPYWETY
ncbi:MAG: pilus assembly protein [Thermoguttaceae bacterium]|nr:pilus assembly protein [Thermoguttaceae bacterium]MDW8038261.1 TadE/TadG family type IV pilus assembly protein [Thermoguttaceae bacterium]